MQESIIFFFFKLLVVEPPPNSAVKGVAWKNQQPHHQNKTSHITKWTIRSH